jgi:hypothetical protein
MMVLLNRGHWTSMLNEGANKDALRDDETLHRSMFTEGATKAGQQMIVANAVQQCVEASWDEQLGAWSRWRKRRQGEESEKLMNGEHLLEVNTEMLVIRTDQEAEKYVCRC